jgi:hypothetical protein
MKARRSLLNDIIKALMEEWGPDEVRLALEKAISESARDPAAWRSTKISARTERVTAAQLVDRLKIEDEKKIVLATIADRFDQKDFLPSVSDVREFIIMSGERPPTMKNRQESFRNLLRVLVHYPPERLRQIVETASHSGPTQLGPISDAIAAAGDRLPRRNHDPES